MNEQPSVNPPGEEWEAKVRETVRHFPYPETPDISASVRPDIRHNRRSLSPIWRIAAAVLLAFLLLMLAVPEVRAVVLDFIQVGVLRIFPVTPTATLPSHTPTPNSSGYSQPTPLASVLDMPGENTLDDARAKSGFDFGLPTYPDDLGLPDHVYLQNYREKLVTLVWTLPDHPDQVSMTIEILDSRLLASKFAPLQQSESVTVRGKSKAVWLPTSSMAVYFFESERLVLERSIQTSVLVWVDNGLTYRLEGDLSKDEAIRVAESMR